MWMSLPQSVLNQKQKATQRERVVLLHVVLMEKLHTVKAKPVVSFQECVLFIFVKLRHLGRMFEQ